MTDFHHLALHLKHFAVDVVRLSIWLVLLVSFFAPIEQLFSLHPAKIWRKQVGVDLAWYFINSLLPGMIIAVPLAFLARALHGLNPGGLYSAVALWPVWLKLLAAFILNDIGFYWAHRASHAFPFLWRFHSIHHSAEHLDWLVNTREHPVDAVFSRLFGLALIYLFGLASVTANAPDKTVVIVTIMGTIWSFFIHANVRFRLGPLEWLISSPAFHHWHHTNDENRNRNFAAVFPAIDWIFGTSWLPKHWPPVYGIDQKMPPTLVGQLISPLQADQPSSSSTNQGQET
jgi:sterol desaturase/sphingolipid hydroxylase (fatty acid hydroxylase superfamily)